MKGKIAASVIAGTLGLAVTGAAALAAFQAPAQTSAVSAVAPVVGVTQTDKDGPHDKVKDILDKLVASGTITQAQEDAILKAFKDAAGEHKKGEAKHALTDLMKTSSDYLGIPLGQLKQQLAAGKSLGEIANATPGKSRDGLIRFDVEQVTAQIDKALADGKITKDQADRLKAHLLEHVTKFVDHKFERKAPAPAKGSPKPSASPKA